MSVNFSERNLLVPQGPERFISDRNLLVPQGARNTSIGSNGAINSPADSNKGGNKIAEAFQKKMRRETQSLKKENAKRVTSLKKVDPKKKDYEKIITPTMANTKKNNFTEHSRMPECCVKGDANGCDCAICSWDPRSALKD